MRDPLDQLEGELTAAAVARVSVAKEWTSCVCLCVFCLCATAVVLAYILHG